MPPFTIAADLSLCASPVLPTSIANPAHVLHRRDAPKPEPPVLLKVFRFISKVSIVGEWLVPIISAWHWMKPRHDLNTLIAQNRIDREYSEIQEERWRRKCLKAEKKARRYIAQTNPILFLRAFVFGLQMGSPQQRLMLKLFRKYNPHFYEVLRDKYPELVEDAGPTEAVQEAAGEGVQAEPGEEETEGLREGEKVVEQDKENVDKATEEILETGPL
jgi:hypothetical protein